MGGYHQKKHTGRESQSNKKEVTTENKWATLKSKYNKERNHWEIVMWDEEYMDKGAVNPTKQKWLKIMWNNHVEGSCRFFL